MSRKMTSKQWVTFAVECAHVILNPPTLAPSGPPDMLPTVHPLDPTQAIVLMHFGLSIVLSFRNTQPVTCLVYPKAPILLLN